jgi:polyhydroxyalkanoate synthase
VLQDFVVKVALANKLAAGEIDVGRKISRFRRIRSAMLVFAGESDVLVPASTARGILDLVNAQDKTFVLAPGGHMGVILGSGAQAAVWERSADWLVSRSLAQPATPAGRATQARSRAPLAGASGPRDGSAGHVRSGERQRRREPGVP